MIEGIQIISVLETKDRSSNKEERDELCSHQGQKHSKEEANGRRASSPLAAGIHEDKSLRSPNPVMSSPWSRKTRSPDGETKLRVGESQSLRTGANVTWRILRFPAPLSLRGVNNKTRQDTTDRVSPFEGGAGKKRPSWRATSGQPIEAGARGGAFVLFDIHGFLQETELRNCETANFRPHSLA